ncbi:MAG: hypothetical protein ABI772_10360, partial [Bacteroidota bacterium]
MKNLFTFLIVLITSTSAMSSHMMGGEITWECSGGNYVFTLKVYRDCRGTTFTTSPQNILVEGHPTIDT